MSRRHAEFLVTAEPTDGGEDLVIQVRDLGSTNGMLVDGHRIASTRLHDGSQVRVGSTTMTVRVLEGA